MAVPSRRQPPAEGIEAEGCGGGGPHEGRGNECWESFDAPGNGTGDVLGACVWVEHSHGGVTSLLLMPLEARLEPMSVAGDIEDVHVVGQAVEQGAG